MQFSVCLMTSAYQLLTQLHMYKYQLCNARLIISWKARNISIKYYYIFIIMVGLFTDPLFFYKIIDIFSRNIREKSVDRPQHD